MTVYIAVLWFFYRKESKGIGVFIIGNICVLLGAVLISGQGIIHPVFSIVIGNVITVAGYSVMHLSFLLLLEKPLINRSQIALFTLIAFSIIEQSVFGIFHPVLKIRIISMTACVGIFYMIMSSLFIKERKQLSCPGYFLLVFFIVQMAVAMVRITLTAVSDINDEFLMSKGVQTIAMALFTVSLSVWPIGFAMLISEKHKQDAVKMNMQNTLLMKELSHRIKNNMSLIISLINLQINDIGKKEEYKSEDVGMMLKIIQNRIFSMAIIHNKLYLSTDLSQIAIAPYIKELSIHVQMGFLKGDHHVSIEYDIEDLIASIETCTHIGLILNELLVNSFKYAFAETDGGIIRIALKKADDTVRLSYSDSGTGIKNAPKNKGIGLQMIEALGKDQLGGNAETPDSGNGFAYSLELDGGMFTGRSN